MRIRSFIIAYALVLAILLFADRRPGSTPQDHYSHVVDLTDEQSANPLHLAAVESRTRIIAPGALIPGTWAAGQIPPERLVAPLVVIDLNSDLNSGVSASGRSPQITLDDISQWESRHGMIPQGAVIAVRSPGASNTGSANDGSTTSRNTGSTKTRSTADFPVNRDAAMFLMDARYTIGFAVETPVDFASDRTLARQLALHGSYVVEGSARFAALPPTGSLVIVAPAKNKKAGAAPVRILAMVR
jgi:kynurenine formamidase